MVDALHQQGPIVFRCWRVGQGREIVFSEGAMLRVPNPFFVFDDARLHVLFAR